MRISDEQIWQAIGRLRTDTSGASAAEYAIILAVIGAGVAMATFRLSNSIACSINNSAYVIAGEDVPPGHQYGHSDPKGLAKGHRKAC